MTDKKPIPSLASLRQNASTTNNLAQLKAKMQNKTPSLASLASSSSSLKKPSTSLQSLATRKTTPSSPSTTITTNNSNTKKLTSLVSKPTVIKKPSIQPHDIKEEQDPLLGKPSAVAQFLFKSTAEPRVFDAHSVFQQATQKPSSIKVFQFDQPSPDDIVLAAQSQRGGKHL